MQHFIVNMDDFQYDTVETLSEIVPFREIICTACLIFEMSACRSCLMFLEVFSEPPRRITMYCPETGYDQFLSDPFVSTCDRVQWPRAARSISLRLAISQGDERERERLALPSARTVLPQSVNMKH
jgi:hypothetical protein